jgi:hypothetical protein
MRLMHYRIEDHFSELELDPKNCVLFVMVSCNAGPRKIARRRPRAKSIDPNKRPGWH